MKSSLQNMKNIAFAGRWHERLSLFMAPIGVAIATLLFYLPSLRYNFQFDDVASITRYFYIRNKTFSELFLINPRWISYWINTIHYKIGKFNPFGYRLFNVSLHAITSILVFYFVYYALSCLRKKNFFSTHAMSIAATTALLFALHPVQTQTVSYVIQGQLEGMAGFFMMSIAFCFLMMHRMQSSVKKSILMGMIFALTFLGTGSKEIFIMMPALLLLVDWFFVAQGDLEDLKQRWMIHAGVFVIVFCMYVYFLKPSFFFKLLGLKLEARNNIGNILTENRTDKIFPLHYFISQFKVVLHYFWIFVWPFNICVEYDWKLSKSFFSFDAIVPFFCLCLGAWYIKHALKRDKCSVVVFALLWFLVVLAPRSTIIPSSELLTDYKTYGGSMGVMLLLASFIVWAVQGLYAQWASCKKYITSEQMQYCMLVLLAFPIGYATVVRNRVWRSGEEFWKNIIDNAPGKARAYNNYAVALSEKKEYKRSIPYYAKAIEMDSSYPDPLNNIAVAYAMEGDLDRGIYYLTEGIKMMPNYPEGYNNLASFLIEKKEYAKAETMLKHAIVLRPHYGKAFFNLGKIYVSINQPEKALEAFKNSCTKGDLDNDPEPYRLWARLSLALQRYDEAIVAHSKLLEFDKSVDTVFNLANAYYLSNNFGQAVQWYTQVLAMCPDDERILYNLGEAYFRLGNYKQAIEYFNKITSASMPALPLRKAACLREMNNIVEAKRTLQEYVNQPDLAENFKVAALTELKRLG